MRAAIGILAAGAARRMRGRDKLLEEVDGEPLLARQIRIARAVGADVLVAVPGAGHPRSALVVAAGVRMVPVPNAEDGMGASISRLAGAAEALPARALMLVLADMPELEAEDLLALLAAADAHPGAIVRAATSDGRPGHPVIFPADQLPALRRLAGDLGARDVLVAADDVRLVRLDGRRAVTDLNTPEAWAAWRRDRSR